MASMINSNPLLEYLEDDKTYDLDFGSTWNAINDGSTSKYAYHTIKYDFKPASVAKSEQAELIVGSTQDVSITMSNVEGSSSQSTKFSGNTKSYTPKECLMIIDPQTGRITLERLSANVRVKNVREENRSINQPIKSAMTRPNTTDSQMDKKLIKPTAQKLTNPSKTTINAPVKPMSTKRTLSPVDDRLSDEESLSDSSEIVSRLPSNPAPVQTNVIEHQISTTTLEQDLQLSDTTDEDD